ncbi:MULTISPECIES: preprotein translocase subunit SecE [Acidocella]|uniref:preprotein translocase subunit SecE n=1 Tax=Acidocella TaxID=50709 RepID=UPI001F3608F5|nr:MULTISPECIES: preprotein translocase subunit SecE [Acidocella]WBO60784.1 preprotein translocase subunit SecE [Acidocella sp. MX-AZ03]
MLKFAREVRTEANRVTWPSGKETVQLTGLVLAMVVIMALLLLGVDSLIGFGMRSLFGA